MEDLFIGNFIPEDDGENTEGGILGNEGKGGNEDWLSRLVLAIGALAVIVFLYLNV